MSRPIFLSLFSGGGFADVGALAAGCELAGAVERDAEICEVYAANLGDHVTCAPVEEVDPRRFLGITDLWLSPPCQGDSCARHDALPEHPDRLAALAACDYLRVIQPARVYLENVPPYAKNPAFKVVVACLHELGYFVWWGNLNAADFGVPQTRRRLVLIAMRDGLVPILPAPVRPWRGWYDAIEDLIPSLPESRFAAWQLKRLPAELPTCLVESKNSGSERGDGLRLPAPPATSVLTDDCPSHWPKAFLVPGGNPNRNGPLTTESGRDAPTLCAAMDKQPLRALLVGGGNTSDVQAAPGVGVSADSEPSRCVNASNSRQWRAFLVDGKPANHDGDLMIRERERDVPSLTATQPRHPFRAWLEAGRVVSMTPRALARFQSVPDSYRLPAKNSLACRVIGNGVPCLLAESIIRTATGRGK